MLLEGGVETKHGGTDDAKCNATDWCVNGDQQGPSGSTTSQSGTKPSSDTTNPKHMQTVTSNADDK